MKLKALTLMATLMVLLPLTNSNPAMAFSSYLSTFNSTYPSSTSGKNASCNLCHASGGGTDLNPYGEAFAAQSHSFPAIEGLNSDKDPTGATNIQEINASTQPGWTPGPNNTLYDV